MILVRSVFRAKYGKGNDLVKVFREARKALDLRVADHIHADASGPSFTVVTETEMESLAEWERLTAEHLDKPGFGKGFARTAPLVESGYRQFYNIET